MKCWPPLKPKTFYLLNSVSKCSPWCLMGPLCSTCVHSHIHLHYMCKMYSQSVQPFDQNFPGFWIVDPLKPPKMPTCGTVGRIVFSLCPFPDESTDMYEIWCQSVEQFDSFPRHLNLWPSKTPQNAPWVPIGPIVGANRSSRLTASRDFWMFVSRRGICLAYIHSQMNLHMCAKFGANRSSRLTASTDFWICDP